MQPLSIRQTGDKTCERALSDSSPRVGVVVGTYAAVPYVHLHLEARRRLFPQTPILVHDDHSLHGNRLSELCEQYGAVFADVPLVAGTNRLGHTIGDLSVFATGLFWAAKTGCDLLLKVSRRFLPIVDVTADLAEVAARESAPLYSTQFKSYRNAIQTNCVGLDVAAWVGGGGVERLLHRMSTAMNDKECVLFVEAIIYAEAERLGRRPQSGDWKPCASWRFADRRRHHSESRFLCHRYNSPADFAALARRWSLPYSIDDFARREF